MMRNLILATSLISLSVLASPSHELTNKEDSLCQSEECKGNYQQLRKIALYGSPTAQLLVGIAYTRGDGLEQDVERGLKWIKKAKSSGSTKAAWLLSLLYREGELVEQDIARADNLLELAVSRNYGPALYDKAISLLDLNGDENQEAIALLKLSKSTGFKQANYLYAKMRETGTVFTKDLFESAAIYRNLNGYRDSHLRFERIIADENKEISASDKVKFTYLEEMEVITVEYNSASFEGYLSNVVNLLKEDGRYDGRGGMSHIAGRICGRDNNCKMLIGEDLDMFLNRKIARKRYPTLID